VTDLDLTGQIGVIPKPSTAVARAIAAITSSHSYHVVVHAGRGQVVSADPGGVRLWPIGLYPDAIWSKFPLRGLQGQQIAEWARAQAAANVQYAWADDALIGCERLLRIKFPNWVRRSYEYNERLQCAQLATLALLQGGIDAWPNDPDGLGDRAPGDFERLFIRKGWNKPSDFGGLSRLPW
jgi:hypothetical protein